MAAIAERIGVSIPAITHHFGSKYGLFMEVIAVSDSIDELRTTRMDAQTGIDRLSAIRFWSHELSSDSALANLSRLTLVMTAEALDADFPAHEHFVVRHRRFRRSDRRNLGDGQRDGSITRRIDPDSVGRGDHGFCARNRSPVASRSRCNRPGPNFRQLLRSPDRCRLLRHRCDPEAGGPGQESTGQETAAQVDAECEARRSAPLSDHDGRVGHSVPDLDSIMADRGLRHANEGHLNSYRVRCRSRCGARSKSPRSVWKRCRALPASDAARRHVQGFAYGDSIGNRPEPNVSC